MNYYFEDVFVLSPLIKEYENRDFLFKYQADRIKLKYKQHTGLNYYNLINNYVFKHSTKLRNNIYDGEVNNWASKEMAACVTQGHLDIIKYSASKNYRSVLLFENDVLFHKSTNQIFDNLSPHLPDDWDILYLGGLYDYSNFETIYETEFQNNSISIVKLNNASVCAHSYALSNNAIHKIVIEFERLIKEDNKFFIIDQLLGHMTHNVGLNSYAFLPKLFEQGDMQTPYLSGNEPLFYKPLDIKKVKIRESAFDENKYYTYINHSDYLDIVSQLIPPSDIQQGTELVASMMDNLKSKIYATEDIYKYRMGICESNDCGFYKKGICGQCGCNMTSKNLIKTTTCPVGKF